jgi:hypothetical protein
MRVSLSTYGGLLPRFGAAHVVDSDELAEHDKEELHRLVSAATATTSAASPPAGSDLLRDAQTYQITIENGGASTVLEATDGGVSEEFAALRNWLRDH